MQIKELRLNNIRSYIDQTINFLPGSLLLSGDVGSGKTSIILAIEFALFGFEKINGESLLRKGEKTGFVELTFELEKEDIKIKRTLKKTKTGVSQGNGFLITQRGLQEFTPIELKAQIFEKLGYPQVLAAKKNNPIFRYAVYCPQEEMKSILIDKNRLDTIRRIFGIDKYKIIQENTYTLLRNYRSNVKENKARIDDLPIKEEHLSNKQKQYSKVLLDKQFTEKQLISENQMLELKKKELIAMQNKKEKLEKRKKELYVTQETKRILENQEKEILEKINKLKKDIHVVIDEQTELILKIKEESLTKIKQKQILLEEKKKQSNKRKEELNKKQTILLQNIQKIPELKKKIIETELLLKNKDKLNSKELEKEQNLIFGDVTRIRLERVALIKNDLENLTKCHVCLQPISSEHKAHVKLMKEDKDVRLKEELQEKEEKYSIIQGKISEIKKKQDELLVKERELIKEKIEFEQLQLQKQEKESNQETIKHLNINLQDIMTELMQFDFKKLKEKEDELKELKEKVIKLKEKRIKEKQLLELKTELIVKSDEKINCITKIIDIEKELQTCGEVNTNLIEKEFQKEQHKVFNLKTKLEKLNTELKYINEQKSLLENEVFKKRAVQEKIKKLQKNINLLDKKFIPFLYAVEKHVFVRIHKEFEQYFTNWFSYLMEDQLRVRLDENFTPIIEQNGYEIGMNSLSGGERTSVSLAYRLSLQKTLTDLVTNIKTKNLLILDEPTEGFSNEQLDKMRDVLDEININQCIIVSHENKIESFVENVIRIAKDGHVSRVIG